MLNFVKIILGVAVWSLLSLTTYSPYTDAWRRVFWDAVGCSDNPSWMYQSTSTERETRRSSDHSLPRPGTLRGLSTTNNSRAGFVSTFSGSTISTAVTATTVTTTTVTAAAVTATTVTATTTAVLTSFLTVLLHVVYPMLHFAVIYIIYAVCRLVFTTLKNEKWKMKDV